MGASQPVECCGGRPSTNRGVHRSGVQSSAAPCRVMDHTEMQGMPPGWRRQWDPESRRHFFLRVDANGAPLAGTSTWNEPQSHGPHPAAMSVGAGGSVQSGGATISNESQGRGSTRFTKRDLDDSVARAGPPKQPNVAKPGTSRSARRRDRRQCAKQNDRQTDANQSAKQPREQEKKPCISDDDRLADMYDDMIMADQLHLDWLRDEHPGLDDDRLADMYDEMIMADAEEFAGENYNSD